MAKKTAELCELALDGVALFLGASFHVFPTAVGLGILFSKISSRQRVSVDEVLGARWRAVTVSHSTRTIF